MPKTVKVHLTQGKVAIIDEIDYQKIAGKNYHYAQGYAVWCKKVNGSSRSFMMHREILGVTGKISVDHINGNRLDNRRKNLRIATTSQNQANRGKGKNNTSGYKGVVWHKRFKKWQALVRVNGRSIFLGFHTNKKAAARAYNKKAAEVFGEFAKVNAL